MSMSLQDSYYSFISNTPLKGVAMAIENAGIPSFPVFIILALLIVGGLGFIVFSSFSGVQQGYSVNVLSSSGPVSGAMVTVSYQGKVLTNYTDDSGNAVFSGVPSNALPSVSVNASGFSFVSKQGLSSGSPINLQTVPASVTLSVQSTGSAPISNANVLYQVGGGAIQSTVTDGNGNAVLTVALNSQVSGTVSASGYQTGNFSFTVSQQSISESVVLNAITTTTNNQALMMTAQDQNVISSPDTNTSAYNIDSNNNFASNASVYVTVSDLNGNPLNATVDLFLNGSSNSFASILASNGTAVFSVGVGSSVYATASLDGYASSSSAADVVSASGLNLAVSLTPVNYQNTTNVTVSVFANSSNGTIPVSGSIYLWTYPLQNVVYESSSYESGAVINVPVGVGFRVGVFSAGYLAQISPLEFALNSSPLEVNFSMVNATLQNSFTLNVSTVDFYNNPVSGAYVSVYDKGVVFPLDIQNFQTDFNGNISIPGLPLPINGFSVSAVSSAYSGKTLLNANSSINGTVSATVVLLPPITTVSVEAYGFDGTPLNATFSSYFVDSNNQPQLIDSCSSQAPSTCSLKVFTGVSLVLQASSNQTPGYLPAVYSSQFNPKDSYFENFTLYPTNSPLLGSFNVFGPCNWNDSYSSCSNDTSLSPSLFNASNGSLTVGMKYYAVFKINVNTTADHYGVYFLTGNSSGDVLSDNAALMKFPVDMLTYSSSDVFNPAYFNDSGDTGFNSGCGSTILNTSLGFYKWVESVSQIPSSASSSSVATYTVQIPFMITASSPEGLNVFYRVFETSNNSYIRDPFDSRLNVSASAPGVQECNAAVYTQRFHVFQDNNSETLCSDQACLKVYCEVPGVSSQARCYNVNVPAFSYQGNVLNVFYNILDMNPDSFAGTPLSIGSSAISPFDSNYLTLAYANLTPAGSYFNNIVNQTIFNSTGSGVLNLTNNGNASVQNIVFTYGSKLSFTTSVNLSSAPQPVSLLPALPSGYIVNYNQSAGNLSLDFLNGSSSSGIQFYSDPIMPADAVFLVLNQSSVSCGQGMQVHLTNLTDQCVTINSIQNDPVLSGLSSYLKAWGGSVYVLRYDPTNPQCSAFSINPNVVNNFNSNGLSVGNICNGVYANFSIQANSTKPTSCSQTGSSSNGYCAVTEKQAWSESAMSTSVNPAGKTNTVGVLINNRVYSQSGTVPLNNTNGGAFNNPQISVQQQITLQDQGGFFTISSMNNSIPTPLINVSGSTTIPAPAFDPMGYGGTSQIPADSSSDFADLVELSNSSFYGSALAVLNNTAFRRSLPNSFGTPIQLSSFPYSAFASVNNTNISFAFGADWLGKSGSGSVDFSFAGVNTPSNCTTQNQRGVYGLTLTYSPSNGTVSIQANPLSFGMQNDFAHLQNLNVQMCGTMSFNPATQNFQNTGDGWYYSAYPGTGGTLSDGHSFNVNMVHPAYNAVAFVGQSVVNAGKAFASCGVSDLAAYGACTVAFNIALAASCSTYCSPSASVPYAGFATYAACDSSCIGAGGNGPGGATANLAGIAAFQGSFSAATAAFDAALKNIHIDVTPGDVYDASSFLGTLNTICQVASPVANTVNSIVTSYKATELVSKEASTDQGSLCGEYASQTFDSSCACGTAVFGSTSSSALSVSGCWIEKGLLAAYSSNSIQTASYNTKTAIDDTKTASEKADATLQTAGAASPFSQSAYDKALVADEEAAGKLESANALDNVLNKPDSKVGWLDESTSVINGLCTYPYMVLGAIQTLGAFGGNKPAYVGIGISGSGSSSWLTAFETVFGSTVQKGNVDCSNAFNFDPSQKTFAWNNFDLVSLRAFEGMNGQCYSANNIKTYVPSGDLNPGSQTATFYISSKIQ